MKFLKHFVILFIAVTLFTCIDPYYPKLTDYQSLLVVDALLTDENISNSVKLSRTIESVDDKPAKVSGATVVIKDDLGKNTVLNEKAAGIYKTDSLTFKAVPGRYYSLYIQTFDGEEYESDPCLLHPVPAIDSLYYEKDQEISADETQKGVRVFIDTEGTGESSYYRWTYEEWWKFEIPEPKMYNYINDSTIRELANVKKTCWANRKSDGIIIQTTEAAPQKIIGKKPMLFLASDKTNRLLMQYCIQIRQLSISLEEYEFWYQMQQTNESGGDIFDRQPFRVLGNLHNITKPDEQVIGFFQVSGVKQKQIYITPKEIARLELPIYRYDCKTIEIGEEDYPPPLSPGGKVTFEKIYRWHTTSGYTFTRPIYNSQFELKKLVFVPALCADCTLSGNLNKPAFWVDIN